MLKSKLYKVLLIISLLFPNIVFAYSDKVILGGENVGIEINSNGILVVGFYNVEGSSPGRDAGILVGDIITKIDDTAIDNVADLSRNSNKEKIVVTYKRNGRIYNTVLKPKKEDNTYKTGIYVKDSIIGIGTLTFIDPENKRYGALGHEIVDQNTGAKIEVKDGNIFKSTVTGIEKTEKGSVGEKNATYERDKEYGDIDKNDKTGIFGNYTKNFSDTDLIDISTDIKVGPASITTVIEGNTKEEFEINILSVDLNHKTKNILFEVTDKTLLEKGNGIVQGMSGSPIKQNKKLVGAVTHVLVDDPHKGYGILITNMLKESEEG